jgi:hypothetical protein
MSRLCGNLEQAISMSYRGVRRLRVTWPRHRDAGALMKLWLELLPTIAKVTILSRRTSGGCHGSERDASLAVCRANAKRR